MLLHGSTTEMGIFFKGKHSFSNYLCSSQDSVALRLKGTGRIPQIWKDVTELDWV